MIVEVLRILRSNKELLLELQETYQYVLLMSIKMQIVDKIVFEFLSGFHENESFVVGTKSKQSFVSRASLENFLYFKKRFPEAEVVSLLKIIVQRREFLMRLMSLFPKYIWCDRACQIRSER